MLGPPWNPEGCQDRPVASAEDVLVGLGRVSMAALPHGRHASQRGVLQFLDLS